MGAAFDCVLADERWRRHQLASGQAFVSNAVVAGRYALRACIVNFNTRERYVDRLPDIVAKLGRVADREQRTSLHALAAA